MLNIEEVVLQKIHALKDITDDYVLKIIDETIKEHYRFHSLLEKEEKKSELFNQFRRFGKIQKLLDDEAITEIMINGPKHIFIEKEGAMVESKITMEETELYDLIQKMVGLVDRKVNERNPICDLRLEDGSRVNVVYDPIGLDGPYVTIRKFPKRKLKAQDIIDNGTITLEAMIYLESMVRKRKNIFVSGGTSSGKTTLLNILSNAIDTSERIITIEDSAELVISGVNNLVRLEARPKGDEYTNPISIRQLIRSSLRMRPDRIIVGEVRGEETIDMLQSMNTGHDGSLSTGHSNSIYDMLIRLETMVISEMDIPLLAIKQQIASAIDLMIHIEKVEHIGRRVIEISEITWSEDHHIQVKPIYKYIRGDDGLCPCH